MAFLLVFGRDSSCFGAKTDRKLHSQPRIHRFRLQRQHPEHALVHPAQRFAGDEAFQRLQAKRELPQRQRPLAAQRPFPQPRQTTTAREPMCFS